jgi:hypothetical protein
MTKSIEELLNLVKSRPAGGKKPPEDNRDVLEFIKDLDIQAGTKAVPNFLIFYVYRMIWKAENSKRKAKKITFFQTFSKHLPTYRHGKQRFYMIKDGTFDVSDEIIKAAEQYDKQHWTKKAQKKVSVP